jgi:hypothetical protein
MGAVNGVAAGKAPPLPPYPFIVSSSYPGTPSQSQVNGPYGISSTSGENSSTANAHIGLTTGSPSIGAISSTSVVNHDPTSGVATAQADTAITAFSLGPLLSIGDITGHAKLVTQPGQQKPTKETSFSVGSLTILGTTVGLTSKGLGPARATPLGVDVSALTGALSKAGITLTYLPAKETPTSVDSAGLLVSFNQQVQTQGQVKVTLTLGRVGADVESGPATATDNGSSGAGSATSSSALGGSGSGTGALGDSGSSAGAGATLGSSGLSAAGVAAPVLASGLPSSSTRKTGKSSGSGTLSLGLRGRRLAGDMGSGLYLALVGAGIVLVTGAGLFEGLGVRLGLRGPRTAVASSGVELRLPDDL